ncbi:hypothetical protein KVR01_013716 [Diaporthe batatas]|uniref:uncharacterized protein n=1 Tax=Diaporthe batatas TaxID=748121 RepID=UPI001D040A8B|nr:uncharacterized protein KVR01_013716 [Diaporthe batatas]KAG8156375.1 hypothetical protein KVR01_013716 [Diaporthe batatas]
MADSWRYCMAGGEPLEKPLRVAFRELGKPVVLARRDPNFLVGHVEFAAALGEPEQAAFLRSVVARLPQPKYMCPAVLVPLDEIPISPHFTTDPVAVQALPLPARVQDEEEEAGAGEALSDTDMTLREIWLDVLPEECTRAVAIRPDTEFFSLRGGSYLLVLIQHQIRRRFDVSVPVMQLFDSSSLRAMASKISTAALVSKVDWDAESALEEGLTLGSRESPASCLTLVLAGATGYLGRRLLGLLWENDAVSNAHGVAVRN